eukprot:m.133126 g.133126  ORF g.133126 m.133126 type:complete len:838 (+) comp14664_c0_seq1:156-2669(+)
MEFRAHHIVSELLDTLSNGTLPPEEFVDILGAKEYSSSTPVNVVTQRSVASRHAGRNGPQFLKLYDELKTTRCRELDPFVYVLGKIVEHPVLINLVTKPSQNSNGRSAKQIFKSSRGGSTAQDMLRSLNITDSDISPENSVKLPTLPDWCSSRPFLTQDYVSIDRRPTTERVGTLSREMQEMALVEDLLNLLVGVEGKFISITGQKGSLSTISEISQFHIDASLDPSLRDLAFRVLPVCVAYSIISGFTDNRSSFASGSVRQALAAAMRGLLKEYLIVVAQVETEYLKGNMLLQRLHLVIQPCMKTMVVLSEVASDADRGNLRGGALLSYLHDRAMQAIGDVHSQELALHLAQKASAPYFAILEQWIYKGKIEDPFKEFLVEEEAGLHKDRVKQHYNDLYWERRYTICSERTPSFLSKLADKILHTGKYLNVMQESGKPPACPDETHLEYQLRERAYVDTIEGAFDYASKSLLTLLTTDCQLMERLQSLKNYFCMSCGDFFSHFLETAEGELSKMVREIVPSRLDALLEMALRVSSASKDPFKDDLRCQLVPHNLITELFRIMNVTHDHRGHERGFVNPGDMSLEGPDSMTGSTLSGMDAFTFEYDVSWPLSLVISRKALKRYQLLFRHLLCCRHVERILCRTWLDDCRHKDTQSNKLAASWQLTAFALRQRMLTFLQSFQYYMMFEVIEPNWHIMAAKLRNASTIDDVLNTHNNFLDNCLKECMLTNPSSLKTISKLLTVCTVFAESMKRIDTVSSTPRGSQNIDADHSTPVKTFDEKFSGYMDDLLQSLAGFSSSASEEQMGNMASRLDFNNYYSKKRRTKLDIPPQTQQPDASP